MLDLCIERTVTREAQHPEPVTPRIGGVLDPIEPRLLLGRRDRMVERRHAERPCQWYILYRFSVHFVSNPT
jgi:hypothetical protein